MSATNTTVLDSFSVRVDLPDWCHISQKAIARGPLCTTVVKEIGEMIEVKLSTIAGIGFSLFIFPHIFTSAADVKMNQTPAQHQTLEAWSHVHTSTGLFFGFSSDSKHLIPDDVSVNFTGIVQMIIPGANNAIMGTTIIQGRLSSSLIESGFRNGEGGRGCHSYDPIPFKLVAFPTISLIVILTITHNNLSTDDF